MTVYLLNLRGFPCPLLPRHRAHQTTIQGHQAVMQRPRLIVGISGATGIVYGIRLLQVARALEIETHLVVTKAGERTLTYETDLTIQELRSMADHTYPDADIGAAIASGSFPTIGMVVAPCSVHSLAEIAHCTTDGLLTRAADVCLKERRRLVLLFREAPLHAGHIRSMAAATENGAIIFPPVPAFYTRPSYRGRNGGPYGGTRVGPVRARCRPGPTMDRAAEQKPLAIRSRACLSDRGEAKPVV